MMMLIGSSHEKSLDEECIIANCLEREELIESQSVSLALIGSGIEFLILVEKSQWMAEWSKERSLFRVRFWR